MSYPLLVQPILDRRCIRCHDGNPGELKAPPILTGEPEGTFTKSYAALKPYVRWYEWGGQSIREIGTEPGHSGADESRLLKIIADKTHAEHVQLSREDYERLCLWLGRSAEVFGQFDTHRCRRNPKFEARNPKQARMTEIENSKRVLDRRQRFDHWCFGFWICFEFRVSCFEFRLGSALSKHFCGPA